MSCPRYDWWGYVKGMIRRYPALSREYAELHRQSITADLSGMPHGSGAGRTIEMIAIRELPSTKQREYEAVRSAIEATKLMANGTARIQLIDLIFWRRSHTLEGAALKIGYSYRTACRYHREFIMMVASKYGLLDK